MARIPRREHHDRLAHITCRTIRRLPLFLTERDGCAMLDLINHVTRDVARWEVLSYCLMPNHMHYVVDASLDQLSVALQRINGLYAQRFNREHGFRGHLFQGRFHSKPIADEAHLPGSIRYVELNPVRAGLCKHPAEWRWSSYQALAGLEKMPAFLAADSTLGLFGTSESAARDAFVRFVAEGVDGMAVDRGLSPGLSPFVATAAAA
jgi:putative transposase